MNENVKRALEVIDKIQLNYMSMNKSYQRVKFIHLREVIKALGESNEYYKPSKEFSGYIKKDESLNFEDTETSQNTRNAGKIETSKCNHKWSASATGNGYQFCINQGCDAKRFKTSDSGNDATQNCEKTDYNKAGKAAVDFINREIEIGTLSHLISHTSRVKLSMSESLEIAKHVVNNGYSKHPKSNELVSLNSNKVWELIVYFFTASQGLEGEHCKQGLLREIMRFGQPKARVLSVEEIERILNNFAFDSKHSGMATTPTIIAEALHAELLKENK